MIRVLEGLSVDIDVVAFPVEKKRSGSGGIDQQPR